MLRRPQLQTTAVLKASAQRFDAGAAFHLHDVSSLVCLGHWASACRHSEPAPGSINASSAHLRGARGLRLVRFVVFGFSASNACGPPVTFLFGNRPIWIGHGPPFISGPGGRCARGVSWKGTNITIVEKEDEAGDCEERRDQASAAGAAASTSRDCTDAYIRATLKCAWRQAHDYSPAHETAGI